MSPSLSVPARFCLHAGLCLSVCRCLRLLILQPPPLSLARARALFLSLSLNPPPGPSPPIPPPPNHPTLRAQAVADECVVNKVLEATSQKTRKDALDTAKAAARENRDKALAKEAIVPPAPSRGAPRAPVPPRAPR